MLSFVDDVLAEQKGYPLRPRTEGRPAKSCSFENEDIGKMGIWFGVEIRDAPSRYHHKESTDNRQVEGNAGLYIRLDAGERYFRNGKDSKQLILHQLSSYIRSRCVFAWLRLYEVLYGRAFT